MGDQSEYLDPEQLPFQLEDKLGKIVLASQPYPDVYHIATKEDEDDLFAGEYYIVLAGTETISQTVKKYGQAIPGHPELLVYSVADDKSGWWLVQYEGLRYLTQNHLKLPEKMSLHRAAVFSIEYHPEYFGTYPAPIITPAGYTLRYKELDQGIYWLETDLCKRMMAVCYPIWATELSDTALSLGEQTEHDRENGIDNTLGYLFFSEQSSCIPLFELLRYRKSVDCIDRAALMNAIWKYFPEYASAYNLEEQSGAHDIMGQLLNSLGGDMELSGSNENMIAISLEAGTRFICW